MRPLARWRCLGYEGQVKLPIWNRHGQRPWRPWVKSTHMHEPFVGIKELGNYGIAMLSTVHMPSDSPKQVEATALNKRRQYRPMLQTTENMGYDEQIVRKENIDFYCATSK
jgi:hypothetical protein